MRARLLVPLILLAAAVAGIVWGLRGQFVAEALEVDAVRVRRGALELVLPVTGTFETRSVDLSFDVVGQLVDISVAEGTAVRQGDVVAALDDAELRVAADQAAAAAEAAAREAQRAAAAVETARFTARQAEAAFRAAQANLTRVQAGPRPSELRAADAAVDAARAAMDQARRTLEAMERLFREGAVSRAQVDAARAQFETAQAQHRQAVAQRETLRAGPGPGVVAAAREQVRQAQAAWQASEAGIRQAEAGAGAAQAHVAQARAAARAARLRAARVALRAPFDGVVTRVFLTPGAPVAPRLPVLSVAASPGWVTAEVDEADAGKVRLGQPARVTADAYPGRTFAGRVARIGRQVELRLGTRIVPVRIELTPPAGLRIGTGVDVDLVLRRVADALLLPVEALATGADGRPAVYVIEGRTLRRRAVRTGESNAVDIVVREGLREGDLAAVADPARMHDGLAVVVRTVR